MNFKKFFICLFLLFLISNVFSVRVVIPASDGAASTLSELSLAQLNEGVRLLAVEAAGSNSEFSNFLKISKINPNNSKMAQSTSERLFDLLKQFYTDPKLGNSIIKGNNGRVNYLEIRKRPSAAKARIRNSGQVASGSATSSSTAANNITTDISNVTDIGGTGDDTLIKVLREVTSIQQQTIEAMERVSTQSQKTARDAIAENGKVSKKALKTARKAVSANKSVSKAAISANTEVSTAAIGATERVSTAAIGMAERVAIASVGSQSTTTRIIPPKVVPKSLPALRPPFNTGPVSPSEALIVRPTSPVVPTDTSLSGGGSGKVIDMLEIGNDLFEISKKPRFFSRSISPKFAKVVKGLIIFQLIIEGFNFLHINVTDNYIKDGPDISFYEPENSKYNYLVKINDGKKVGLPKNEFYVITNANENIFARKNFLENRLAGDWEGFKDLSIYNAYQEQLSVVGENNGLVTHVTYSLIYDNYSKNFIGDCIFNKEENSFDCSELSKKVIDGEISEPNMIYFLVETNPMVVGSVIDVVEHDLKNNGCNYLNLSNNNFCILYEKFLDNDSMFAMMLDAKDEAFDNQSYWGTALESFVDGLKGTYVDNWVEVKDYWVDTKDDFTRHNYGSGIKTLSVLRSTVGTVGAAANSILYVFGGFAAAPIISTSARKTSEKQFDGFLENKLASRAIFIGLPVFFDLNYGFNELIEPVEEVTVEDDETIGYVVFELTDEQKTELLQKNWTLDEFDNILIEVKDENADLVAKTGKNIFVYQDRFVINNLKKSSSEKIEYFIEFTFVDDNGKKYDPSTSKLNISINDSELIGDESITLKQLKDKDYELNESS